jgi:hypothetical protein
MSTLRLPRREFLLRALGACSAPLLARATSRRLQGGTQPARSAGIATRYFGPSSAAAARALAEAYVRARGFKTAADAPIAATLQLIARGQSETAAIAALVRAVRSDFRNGRVVDLDGWIVSRTEGELCVMVVLGSAK